MTAERFERELKNDLKGHELEKNRLIQKHEKK